MSARVAAISAIAWGCLTIGGCGGDGSAASTQRTAQAQVRELLPEAKVIRCSREEPTVTLCHALVGDLRRGIETWTCEFTVEPDGDERRYAGSWSCWSRNGRPGSLQMGGR